MTRRVFALFAMLLTIAIGYQPPLVWAHSELFTAIPAPGTALDTAPDQIRLTFSEPLAIGSTLQLFGQNFQPVSGIAATIDRNSPEDIIATATSLRPGDYTVQWTSVAHDGDTLSGSYSFTLLAEAQNDTRLLIWGVAVVGSLVLLGGLIRLYQSRVTTTKKIGEAVE